MGARIERSDMNGFLFFWLMLGVLLHVALMGLETLPPSCPVLLRLVSKRRLKPLAEELVLPQKTPLTAGTFTPPQQKLVANIVKNAGIYNGIIAALLFATAYAGDREIARVLLTGIIVSGVFGGMALSSWAWAQAVFGVVGIVGFYLLPSNGQVPPLQ
jgi:uncharacterized membrane protein